MKHVTTNNAPFSGASVKELKIITKPTEHPLERFVMAREVVKMIKYKANFNGVEAIEIKGETAKFVTLLSGIREAKMSAYKCYFDTWEKAHAHLMEKVEKDIRKYRTRLEMALAYKEKLEAMRKP